MVQGRSGRRLARYGGTTSGAAGQVEEMAPGSGVGSFFFRAGHTPASPRDFPWEPVGNSLSLPHDSKGSWGAFTWDLTPAVQLLADGDTAILVGGGLKACLAAPPAT